MSVDTLTFGLPFSARETFAILCLIFSFDSICGSFVQFDTVGLVMKPLLETDLKLILIGQ